MQLNIGESSAFDVIKDTYDYETCKEITEHGCVSGVATSHVYYKDTVAFFDKYEDEITTHISETLGDDVLPKLFKDANASLTSYKNAVTWSFIELVAMDTVDNKDKKELEDEATIASYAA